MNAQPVFYIATAQLARSIGMAAATVERRLEKSRITPDGFIRSGSRISPVFAEARTDQLRQALGLHTGPDILAAN